MDKELSFTEESMAMGDDHMDFANLICENTGIPGVICITTKMGIYGPRVKYRPDIKDHSIGFSMTINDHPAIVANSLPAETVWVIEPLVRQWILLNKEMLLRYWNEAAYMLCEEVEEMVSSLIKIR